MITPQGKISRSCRKCGFGVLNKVWSHDAVLKRKKMLVRDLKSQIWKYGVIVLSVLHWSVVLVLA